MKIITITRVLALMATLLPAGAGLAQDASSRIDTALSTCMATDAAMSTPGQVDCMGQALEDWDKELNRVYAALTARLDPPSRELLRNSQRQWLAFRDAEREFHAGPWRLEQGSIMRLIVMDNQVSMIKERVRELSAYLQAFDN